MENTGHKSSLKQENMHTNIVHLHGGTDKEQTMLCLKCLCIWLMEGLSPLWGTDWLEQGLTRML